jgi:hypothetical protein
MWWRLPIPWMATNISGNAVLPLFGCPRRDEAS